MNELQTKKCIDVDIAILTTKIQIIVLNLINMVSPITSAHYLLPSPGRSLQSWLQKTRLSLRVTHLSVCDHLKRSNQPLPCSGAARNVRRGPRAMCDTCLIKLSLEKLSQETRGDRRQPCSNFSLFSPLIGRGVR